jgi:hypothetical protein
MDELGGTDMQVIYPTPFFMEASAFNTAMRRNTHRHPGSALIGLLRVSSLKFRGKTALSSADGQTKGDIETNADEKLAGARPFLSVSLAPLSNYFEVSS